MEGVVYRYTYTTLTLAHAEGASKLNLVAEIVLCNQTLKLCYYLAGAFNMTGASDTNSDLNHKWILSFRGRVYCGRFLALL